jgi:hypothetical protein
MASAMNKEERLAYIKECALRIREEKIRDQRIAETETEFAQAFSVESDLSTMDEYCGMLSEGVAKIKGGLRHLPVFIL